MHGRISLAEHDTDKVKSRPLLLSFLAGVGGAYLGMPLLDPLGGLLVAGMITQAGVVIGWRAVQELIDGSSATQETVKAVEDALATITVRPTAYAIGRGR